jgi:hypothetical protein
VVITVNYTAGYTMNEDAKRPLQVWADKIDFTKRAKAICKPCWELKYCPYGPLVEQFPVEDVTRDEMVAHNEFLKRRIGLVSRRSHLRLIEINMR